MNMMKNHLVSYFMECSDLLSRISLARSALYHGVILNDTTSVLVNKYFYLLYEIKQTDTNGHHFVKELLEPNNTENDAQILSSIQPRFIRISLKPLTMWRFVVFQGNIYLHILLFPLKT